MVFAELFDVDDNFRADVEIKKTIKNSKNYRGESPDDALLLNFFSTSKQRSYLVVTNQMIYCIVDDIRKSEPRVNWSKSRDRFDANKITVTPKSDRTGLVNFGNNSKNWLFTKSKFVGSDIGAEVANMLNAEI